MNAQQIIEKLVNNNGRYIDDHVRYGDPVRSCTGYTIINGETGEYVCPLFDGPYASINPLYLEDGELRLSGLSIGLYTRGEISSSLGLVEKVVWFDQAA